MHNLYLDPTLGLAAYFPAGRLVSPSLLAEGLGSQPSVAIAVCAS